MEKARKRAMRLQAMAVVGGKFPSLGTNDPTGAVTNIRECDLRSEASSAPPPSTCTPHETGRRAPPAFASQALNPLQLPGRASPGSHGEDHFWTTHDLLTSGKLVGGGGLGGPLEESRFLESQNGVGLDIPSRRWRHGLGAHRLLNLGRPSRGNSPPGG